MTPADRWRAVPAHRRALTVEELRRGMERCERDAEEADASWNNKGFV